MLLAELLRKGRGREMDIHTKYLCQGGISLIPPWCIQSVLTSRLINLERCAMYETQCWLLVANWVHSKFSSRSFSVRQSVWSGWRRDWLTSTEQVIFYYWEPPSKGNGLGVHSDGIQAYFHTRLIPRGLLPHPFLKCCHELSNLFFPSSKWLTKS